LSTVSFKMVSETLATAYTDCGFGNHNV
jgi:hypothetical protein